MDPQVRSSFIPKKPLPVQSGRAPRPRKKSFDMLSFVGTILFLIALGATGYTYWIEKSIQANINDLATELQEVKDDIDFAKLEEFEAFERKLETVERLLNAHSLMSGLLTTMNENTLHNVGYSSFAYGVEENNQHQVKITGTAASYNALSLQTDEFRRNELFDGFSFEELQVAEEGTGGVTFGLTLRVNDEELLFRVNQEGDE